MTSKTRTLLTLAAMTTLLVACGTTPAADPTAAPTDSPPPSASVAPSEAAAESPEASASADESPEPVGTLTVADGAVADGPGADLVDAIGAQLSEPTLVNGTVFLDEDGQVWLTDSVEDASVPTFGDLRVRIENYPTDGPTWDMDAADITGLQEANGIRFYEDTQLFGTLVTD
jgi:hypothetical protein